RIREEAHGLSGASAVVAVARTVVAYWREHPAYLSLSAQAPLDDREAWEALVDAALPLRTALRSLALDEEDVDHWERILWTSLYGFTAMQHAGMFRRRADPEQSLELMLQAFLAEVERAG